MADAEKGLEFINRLVEEGALIGEDEPQSLEQEEKFLEELLAAMNEGRAAYRLAEHEGRMVGGSMVQRGRGRQKHVAMLSVAVDRDFRLIGLGERLVRLAIEDARRMEGVTLLNISSFAINTPAITLYEKLGFGEVARVPDEWLVDEKAVDLIIMHRGI